MSTLPHVAASTAVKPLENVLFDYHGADIILRSQDCYHFRVPKTPIVNNSLILGGVIQRTLDSPSDANPQTSLPVVQLRESGVILRCLLTFIFPVIPVLPLTPEETMELLYVAQKYQMEIALTHIRGSIGRQNSLSTRRLESALHIYALAQKYGLLPEALQAARAIFLKQSMAIEDFDNNFDAMPCASLYELWKYDKRVRAILVSDLTDFRVSRAYGTIAGLGCTELSPSQIPSWLDRHIESVGKSPNLFDYGELIVAMARHTKEKAREPGCECASISSHTIGEFWEAFESEVDGSFKKAESESALSLVQEQEDPQVQIYLATSPLELFDISDTNFVIRSSDLVDFRVHKSILAMVSVFFRDLLSLPQPSDGETTDDGLPVVRLHEGSELLNSLISILYPVRTMIPTSYEKVLYLLAACQKYDMPSVQSSIRAGVNRGEYPAPKGAEAFTAYAIASAKRLIPEMENAARQTLDHPMSFEVLGEGLRMFEGWVLRDLVNFRRRCRDNVVKCLDLFLDVRQGPSRIWAGCPEVRAARIIVHVPRKPVLPKWLNQLLTGIQNDLKRNFISPLDISPRIRREYTTALIHDSCDFCSTMHDKKGSTFLEELDDNLAQARNKVRGDIGSHSSSTTNFNPRNR